MAHDLDPLTELTVEVRLLKETFRTSIAELKSELQSAHTDFVSRSEFEPVKRIAFGMVGLVCTSVILALIALIVKK